MKQSSVQKDEMGHSTT